MSRDPYCRLYWRFADEFPEIWDDDAANALWHRLLRIGDMAWPSDGVLPLTTKRKALDALVSAGLVELHAGGRFRIRGMDKERQQRSDAARTAIGIRWKRNRDTDGNTGRITDSNTETIPSRAEPIAEPIADSTDGIFDTYYQLTARAPSRGAIDWLRRLVDDHGESTVIAALALEHKADSTPTTLLSRVQTRLADRALKAEKAAEERRKRAAIDEVRALEDAMPQEERQANLVRLGDMMREKGLI